MSEEPHHSPSESPLRSPHGRRSTAGGGFVLYREDQRLWSNPLVRVLVPAESVLLGVVLLALGVNATPSEQLKLGLAWVGCGLLLPTLIACWRLRIEVTETTLRAWFAGLPRWRLPLELVESAHAERVDPIGDLGGWGIRWTKRHGRVLNVSGEEVVVVTMVDGRVRTLGTQRPDELASVVFCGAAGEPGLSRVPVVGSANAPVPAHSGSGTSNA